MRHFHCEDGEGTEDDYVRGADAGRHVADAVAAIAMSVGVRHNTSKPNASIFSKLNAAFFADLAKRVEAININRGYDIPYLGGYSTKEMGLRVR